MPELLIYSDCYGTTVLAWSPVDLCWCSSVVTGTSDEQVVAS